MKVAVIYNKDLSSVINVFGMQNREHYNPKTVEMAASALEKNGHNVRVIDGNMNVIESLKDFMPRVMSGERPGMVFNMAYGIQGESRYTHLPAMLEMLGVPYVGSGPSGHALALDKVIAKIVFHRYGVPTPDHWVFSSSDESFEDISYPVIVKPKNEAVSYGLKVVYNEAELREATEFIINEYQQQALVEDFIEGREFAIGLLGNEDPEVLPIVEFDFSGDTFGIQTVENKLEKPVRKICPADISEELEERLKKVSKQAFRALGLYDFCRVDIRVDSEENVYVLEVNSMASLGPTGSYVEAAKKGGYTYDQLVNRMLEVASVRYFGQEAASIPEISGAAAKPKKASLHVRVRGFLRTHQNNIEDMLREIIDINSYARNIEGVNACGNWITKKMNRLGFHRQVFPQTAVGNVLLFSNHTASESDVLLLGHLDIPYRYKEHIPFRESGSRLYGSGISENKGGLIVMLAALQALRYTRTLKNIRCSVLLTTDDWLKGSYSREIVEKVSKHAKYILGLKQGSLDGGVVTSRAGSSTYYIEFMSPRSTSKDFESNCIHDLCRKVMLWQKLTDEEKGIIVGVTGINADAMFGRVPEHASVNLSIRFNDLNEGQKLDEKIKRVAEKKGTSGVKLQVTGGIRRPPMRDNEKTEELWEIIEKTAGKLHVAVTEEHRWSSSDICFVSPDKPRLCGLGPVGGDNYSANEYIVRSSLVDRSALLATSIYNLSQKRKSK